MMDDLYIEHNGNKVGADINNEIFVTNEPYTSRYVIKMHIVDIPNNKTVIDLLSTSKDKYIIWRNSEVFKYKECTIINAGFTSDKPDVFKLRMYFKLATTINMATFLSAVKPLYNIKLLKLLV